MICLFLPSKFTVSVSVLLFHYVLPLSQSSCLFLCLLFLLSSSYFNLSSKVSSIDLKQNLTLTLKNIYLFSYLFGCTRSQLWHVRSSSLTRDQTWAPCIRSAESQPLDHQGSPSNSVLIVTSGFLSSHFSDKHKYFSPEKPFFYTIQA